MSGHKVNFFEDRKPFSEEKDEGKYLGKSNKKLTCKNFGFECNFITCEEEIEKIVEEFREHAMQDHFTDYPSGILKKSLI